MNDDYLNLKGLKQFLDRLKALFVTKTDIHGLKGEDGVSITSVEQTTFSASDDGINTITVTLSDGTQSTFNIKNGSKGSTGAKGDTGAAGANATTTAVATTSANGLMSKEMVQKLGAIDGITSDINSESNSIAASSKMVHDLNSSLKNLFVTRTITKSITVQYLQQILIPITTISSYTPIAISGHQIDYRIKTYGMSIVGSNISIPASSADGTQVTANVTFNILYTKS